MELNTLLQLPRVDGFDWIGRRHGHHNDCLRVYRDGGTVLKTVLRGIDDDHVHEKLLQHVFHLSLAIPPHPYVLRPLEWVWHHDYCGVRFPYYPQLLDDVLGQRDRKIVWKQARDAVAHLYQHYFVHGDLVQKNFFWDREHIVLFDFQTLRYAPTLHRHPFEFSPDYCGQTTHASCCGPFPSKNLLHLQQELGAG